MRSAFLLSWIASLMLTGCASSGSSGTALPSLHDLGQRSIVQVDADFDPRQRRDYPYFVVCAGTDCPVPSRLTPVTRRPIVALPASSGARPTALPSASASAARSGQPRREVTLLPEYRVHFGYASAELDDAARQKLARFVSEHPGQTILITGYTDSISKPGGTIGNRWLAQKRALSVKRALIDLGYPEGKISLEAKFLCCYIDSNETPAGRRNNRRAEISVIHTRQR